jgi:Lipopolysaccharide-assembly
MNRWLLILTPVFALLLSNCAGYKLGSAKPSHMATVTKLHVPTFSNDTLEPRLAVLLTNAVIKQIQAAGSYQIVGPDDADATLRGEIDYIDRSQWRAVRTNTLRTREILELLRVNYKVVDGNGVTLHTGRTLGQSYIVLDPNFQLSETQALSEAAERLAVALVGEISDGW